MTSLLHTSVVWVGCGASFTACIALEPAPAAPAAPAVRQRIYTCGANECGQLGLGGTFAETPAGAGAGAAGAAGRDLNGYDTTRGGGFVSAFRAVELFRPLPQVRPPAAGRGI